MGRSKNRRKRRLGRLYKQATNADSWVPYYEFSSRSFSVLDLWCGFDEWFQAADYEIYDKYYDEKDEKELEFEISHNPDSYGQVFWPNQTDYGTLRRYAKHLRAYLDFDDSKVKGKQYHSRRATYWRNRRKRDVIKQFFGWFEEKFQKCMETCPDQIELWIVELRERAKNHDLIR